MPKVTMNTKEVAELLQISRRRVQELAAAKIIPALRPEGRQNWVFMRTAVAKYLGVKPEEI